MAERSLGQVACETYGQLRRKRYPARLYFPWDELDEHERADWEAAATAVLEACGGSGCQSPHGPDGRCFDCAADDEMAAAIPPPPGGSDA
jgi:hypothetical protein